MSASIDPENDTTTIAFRGALRLRWSRIATRADEIRAEISARGFGESAARNAAIEAVRPELRALLTEVLTHAPLALLRTHVPRLVGWQMHVEPFLVSDSVLLGLIDGASPQPLWARTDAGDVACDDARWPTWCAAWLGELRTRDINLATALAGATTSPNTSDAKPTAEAPMRAHDASGIPAVVKQGLDLINWLSNGMAGAHEARRQRVAREADRQRPLLVDDVLAASGATLPRLDQMVGVLMKDPVECRRVADMIAGHVVNSDAPRTNTGTSARAESQPAAPSRLRARDFMPDAFFARMAAERAATERAATERAATERAAPPPATTTPPNASPSAPSGAPSATRTEAPSDEAIDARLDALRLRVFTRQGDFDERMSRAEQKLALVTTLHEKAQRAIHSLREEFLRLQSSAPAATDAASMVDGEDHADDHDHDDTNTTDHLGCADISSDDDSADDREDNVESNTDDNGTDDDDTGADAGADANATTTPCPTFDAIFDELTAPSAPTTADSSPPSPNLIRIAKLDALAAHFDIMADANDARLDAIERAADLQLHNATALLAALEDLHVQP